MSAYFMSPLGKSSITYININKWYPPTVLCVLPQFSGYTIQTEDCGW